VGRFEKTLNRVLRGTGDANVAFADLCALLRDYRFEERIRGSHHIFTRSDVQALRGNMPDRVQYEIVLYWSKEDQAFVAEVPELPGCAADGATYQDALANVEVVIREWIETARELGRPIPEPRGRLMYA
jgi:predicted RNase H-like HicB family nuclease